MQDQTSQNGFYLADGSVDPDAVFAYAVSKTLAIEKGLTLDPDDPGKLTKYGISQSAFPNVDIKNLTLPEAQGLYFIYYWKLPKIDRVALINPSLSVKLFDLAVNCGQKTAIRMMQRGVNVVCAGEVPPERAARWRRITARLIKGKPIATDGIIGPITLSVIGACPYQAALLMALRGEAYRKYQSGKPLYIPGWLTRLAG